MVRLLEGHERLRDVPEVWQRDFGTVAPDAPVSVAVEALLARPESRGVYVVAPDGRPTGVLSFRCLVRVTSSRFGVRRGPGPLSLVRYFRDLFASHAKDVMRPATPVSAETTVRDALGVLEETRQNDLPIVDADGRLVGEVNGACLLRVALTMFAETEATLARDREAQNRRDSAETGE